MNLRRTHFQLPIFSILIALFATSFFAQSKPKKRPKLKDFGSSLERLRWDPNKKQAVESKRRSSAKNLSAEDTLYIETDLVSSDILVVDEKGKWVDELKAEDVLVYEDGVTQEVAHFSRGDNTSIPRTIVLIIDYSCTQLPVLRRSVDAAKQLVDKLGPSDTMAVVTDDVKLIVNFTNDKKKLKRELESVYKRPNTPFDPTVVTDWHTWGKGLQYSALMAVLKEAFIEEDLRPIIIFQTDGTEVFSLRESSFSESLPPDLPEDFRAELVKTMNRAAKYRLEHHISDFSLDDVHRAVEKSRATIYTVVPGFRIINRGREQQMKLLKRSIEVTYARALATTDYWGKKRILDRLDRWRIYSVANLTWWAEEQEWSQNALSSVASRSGGWTEFLESAEDADGIYDRILADINHRYIVGYYPKDKTHNGAERKIKFEVRGHPKYKILSRTSYLARVLKKQDPKITACSIKKDDSVRHDPAAMQVVQLGFLGLQLAVTFRSRRALP